MGFAGAGDPVGEYGDVEALEEGFDVGRDCEGLSAWKAKKLLSHNEKHTFSIE